MRTKKIFLLVLIILAVLAFFLLDLGRFLTLESLQANRMTVVDFYRTHKTLTMGLFVGIYLVQTALSLPGAAILTLAAGGIFGVITGTLLANLGATLGATLAFVLVRYLFGETVRRKFGGRLERLNRELEHEGLHYLLFLRLVPLFPFFLINLAAGLTRLPLRTFFLGTLLGIVPGSFVYANAGASLASITSLQDIVSPRVLLSFALLGVFALIPVMYRKVRSRRPTDLPGEKEPDHHDTL